MKKITVFITLLVNTIVFSQQIGDGFAPVINDFTLPLKSGLYNGENPIGGIPNLGWKHLFVIRNSTSVNNYQLQISSAFLPDDRLFFRKIATGGTSNPVWVEIATKGSNTFYGNQIVNGKVGIGISLPSAYLEVLTPIDSQGIYETQKWNSANPGYTLKLQTIWNTSGINYEFIQRYNDVDYKSLVFYGGNVGIGISNPDTKLAVNGTIHSKEVKVDMNGWSDFVFKKEYDLPTLEEVEKHINEKGHLENIPSEEEVLKNGINLGEMDAKLLQKIEELTLYMIEMKNKQLELEKTIKELNNKIK
ncbi:hypothetical protein GKZ90_0025090 [Flavobacterium sp. MC2016-06]|jgi:hypothetical protein|uniref:hypothetical protein n=1 Tax=Flavobacterium sp. MC2016-06 TaxID=2676308 RepID=UPI0012BB1216|nr:hypothetical protein [Flavobacterium sp. MC2016-06]MBU3862354.1 hypothetical protein [Flavobacterium sp. MC2016-06]